jgi:tetratricopeptide (TPR) repeat protein
MHARYPFLILLALGLCAPLAAQMGGAMIIGQIRTSASGSPPERIRVTLHTHGQTVGDTLADEQGKFTFGDLLANPYFVSINYADYQPVWERVHVDPKVQLRYFVHINLRPRSIKNRTAPAEGANPNVVDIREYTRKFPREVKKEFADGIKAEKKQKVEKALAHYQKAIQLAPDFYPAHNNLGSLYLSTQQFDLARAEFETVVRINPNDPSAYFNLANLYLLTERYEEALKAAKQGLEKHPDSPFGHFLLGSVQSRIKNYTEGERSLKRALELQPEMPEGHLQLVNLYVAQNRTAEAISQLEAFREEFPNDPRGLQAKALLQKLKADK